MGIGSLVTKGGIIARRAEENALTGQRQAANQLDMADRFRNVQREMEQRRGRAARFPQNPNPVPQINMPQVGVTSVPGAPPPVRPLPDQRIIPGQQAPAPQAPPMLGENPTPTGVHTGGFPSHTATPRPGGNPYQTEQLRQLRQQMGHGLTPVGSPQISTAGPMTPPGVPQSNQNPNPLPDQTLGGAPTGVAAVQPQPQRPAMQPVVQDMGASRVASVGSQAPATAQTAPSGPTQMWSAETSPERYQVAQLDAMIKQMEADYQRVLPHAQDAEAAQYLANTRQQLIQASIGRNQLMLNDSFNEMAATGDPSRVTQVMNAMGYKIKFKSGKNGRLQVIGADGKKTSEGFPHELAGNLRMAFNSEFQKLRMEANIKERQLHIEGGYGLKKSAMDNLGKVQASRGRNVEYGRIQAGKPQTVTNPVTGKTYILRDGKVYDINQPSDQTGGGGRTFRPDPVVRQLGMDQSDLGLPPAPGSEEFNRLFAEDGSDTWP